MIRMTDKPIDPDALRRELFDPAAIDIDTPGDLAKLERNRG